MVLEVRFLFRCSMACHHGTRRSVLPHHHCCSLHWSCCAPSLGMATRLQLSLSNILGTACQLTPLGGWMYLRIVNGTRSLLVSDCNNFRCEFRYASTRISP